MLNTAPMAPASAWLRIAGGRRQRDGRGGGHRRGREVRTPKERGAAS